MHADDVSSSDRFNLQRFIDAQDGVIDDALTEIRAGQKRSHWMWFIFPQFAGLGFSPMAQKYAIQSLDEARAYLQHPQLGKRLVACAQAVLGVDRRSAQDIFGGVDSMKLRSSMTLFAAVAARGSVFDEVIQRYFQGNRDERTMQLIGK